MYDFGEYERKQFLADEQRKSKTLKIFLLLSSLYFIIHIGYYLLKG